MNAKHHKAAEYSRNDHRNYFKRNGGFDLEMMLVCEHFKLVEDFGVVE